MDTKQLDAFIAVCRCGGFAPAARSLDLAPSTVSRAVAGLERALGVRLLTRTSRAVALTEAGEAVLRHAEAAVDALAAARAAAALTQDAPRGVLRVAASVSFGQVVIAPSLKRFHERFPGITVELFLSDDVIDMVAKRVDLAVRHGALSDSALVARRLHTVQYMLVASPTYLSLHPPIRRPADVAGHAALTFTFAPFVDRWSFERDGAREDVPVGGPMRCSNAAALAASACNGMGIALLADWTCAADVAGGRLVRVLPDWTAGPTGADAAAPIWLVRPAGTLVPPKVAMFEDHLVACCASLARGGEFG